jgi:hypothetical protein
MDKPKDESELARLKPGSIHFLRRMKESLVDYDSETRLFRGRHASNLAILLSPDPPARETRDSLADSPANPTSWDVCRVSTRNRGR